MESSPYFVLEECQIKRDECAFVQSKTSYFAVWQLTRFITFQGKEYVRLKWENKIQEEWIEKVHTFKKDYLLAGNAKSRAF